MKGSQIRGGVKKMVLLGGGGQGGGSEARPQLSAKKVPLLFLPPFDAETFKTCKNTIKGINLCALPCLWLTLKVYFDLA